MGDTWIYGIASDPQKMRVFREISRQRAEALSQGEIHLNDPSVMEFSELLVKLPGFCQISRWLPNDEKTFELCNVTSVFLLLEHTWGLLNTMMFNFNYSNVLFHAERNTVAVKLNEASWTEQRLYNYMYFCLIFGYF
jgi:hypothetical protein